MNNIGIKELKYLKNLKQKKYRKMHKKLIVEGENMISQLLDNGKTLDSIYITKKYAENHLKHLEKHFKHKADTYNIKLISEAEIKALTDTESPQDIIACASFELSPIKENGNLLYLDGIQDPGNMGTIIRTALAAGIDGVLISPESCDIMNPKVVRASLGAVFFCPIAFKNIEYLQQSKHQIIAFTLDNAKPMYELKSVDKQSIIVIGSETQGVSKAVLELANEKIFIPMTNKIESLNAAVSTGIALYYIKGLAINE